HRCLAGCVAAAGENNSFVATQLALQRGGSVINADTFELFAAFSVEPAIIGASGNQDSFCAEHRTATFRLEACTVLAIRVVLQGEGGGWCGKFRAEPIGLQLSEPG